MLDYVSILQKFCEENNLKIIFEKPYKDNEITFVSVKPQEEHCYILCNKESYPCGCGCDGIDSKFRGVKLTKNLVCESWFQKYTHQKLVIKQYETEKYIREIFVPSVDILNEKYKLLKIYDYNPNTKEPIYQIDVYVSKIGNKYLLINYDTKEIICTKSKRCYIHNYVRRNNGNKDCYLKYILPTEEFQKCKHDLQKYVMFVREILADDFMPTAYDKIYYIKKCLNDIKLTNKQLNNKLSNYPQCILTLKKIVNSRMKISKKIQELEKEVF